LEDFVNKEMGGCFRLCLECWLAGRDCEYPDDNISEGGTLLEMEEAASEGNVMFESYAMSEGDALSEGEDA
jgi:hypothetical protein